MKFYVMTLFPEMIRQGMQTSILGRAMENGLLSLETLDIREYTENKHKKVDDYPYGGGAGMLMQAQPVFDCYQAVLEKIRTQKAGMEKGRMQETKGQDGIAHGRNSVVSGAGPNRETDVRVIYLTPQGKPFRQKMAAEFSKEENLIFLCGHYEGIDERVLEEIVTDYVSIGDYVLTGGELPAMVMMDAIARLVPGVLHNDLSADFETFHNDLLEYPQYSRPEEWHGKQVPKVLLSGDHRKVEEWRLEQSEGRTERNRPDMYALYKRKQHYIQYMLKKGKLLYIDIIESLRRGNGEILEASKAGILVGDEAAGVCMIAAFDEARAEEVAGWVSNEDGKWQYIVHQECLLDPLGKQITISECIPMYQAVYTQRTAVPVSKNAEIRVLGIEFLDEVMAHYHMMDDRAYMEERLQSGNIFGAFVNGGLAGFAGVHKEGSLGMLEVYEEYRRQGIGCALEAFMVNRHLSMGYTPYGNILEENQASLELQGKLGLCMSRQLLYWLV